MRTSSGSGRIRRNAAQPARDRPSHSRLARLAIGATLVLEVINGSLDLLDRLDRLVPAPVETHTVVVITPPVKSPTALLTLP